MAGTKISTSLKGKILELGEKQLDAAMIAREVNLSRMQVAAILAHARLRNAQEDFTSEEDDSSSSPPDLWGEPTQSSAPEYQPEIEASEEEDEPCGIFVGDDIEYEAPVFWDPANARQVQNPHLMVMGESGSGKTYALQCLVAELAHIGIPSIIFDYGQSFEMETLNKSFLKHCSPREYLIGEDGLSLNPLHIFDSDKRGPNSVSPRLADVFDAVFKLGHIQKKVFIDAVSRVYELSGITMSDQQSWRKIPPSIMALRDAIDDLAADKQHYPNYKNAAGLSARLATFFMLAAFRTDDVQWSWERLINDETSLVHILQFRGLEGKTQRVLVELLLWHLFYHLKSHGQKPLHIFCVLDEAHHISFRESGPMNALLREARKFGIGIIFASQQPEDFSPVAYSNSASKLIFQTSDPTLKISRYLTSKSSNFNRPEDIRDIISELQQGKAFFMSKNRGYTVHIADLATRATMWKEK